ncbi:MAG: hypothetical protein K8S18_22355 [Desulfobacula sp.]|nr:hypothetical protein [Desulfobacula sp.]
MNDFLQSLRSNHAEKQRMPMTRKNYDAAYDNPNHRFHSSRGYRNYGKQYMNSLSQPCHRGNQMPVDEVSPSMLQGAIASLSNHVESLAENQKYLLAAQEKTAVMLERQVIAIERILDYLNISPE